MEKEQLSALLAQLDEMAGMIDKMRESIPADSAEEQSEAIDEATAPEVEGSADDSQLKPADDKDVRKAAMVSMLKKSI